VIACIPTNAANHWSVRPVGPVGQAEEVKMASQQFRNQTTRQVPRANVARQAKTPLNTTLLASFAVLALTLLVLSAPYLAVAKDKHDKKQDKGKNTSIGNLPATDLTEDEAIAHALNRLGFGPRPGDTERVKQMGLSKWIDLQLHPESINDSALDARLQRFPTLTMSPEKLLATFPRPQVAAKREGVTIEEYRKEQQEKLRAARQASNPDAPAMVPAANQVQGSPDGGQHPDAQQPDAQQPDMQQDHSPADAPNSQQFGDKPGQAPDNSPGIAAGNAQSNAPGNTPLNNAQLRGPQRIVAELAMAKVDRAIYSERQLDEQMVNFWFNHFNVFAGKGQDRWLLTSYERDAIRPNAMGKFRDLLGATAKSPAMLFFLDNWQSVDPQAFARMQQQQTARRAMMRGRFGGPFGMPQAAPNRNQQKKQDRGLNENYGRELMELHTLGVDGGYTQQDVVEVAKCFTGWTIRMPQRDPEFWFDERLHDPNPKTVLGHEIKAGGIKDGEEVLDLLARDPHTAHHLSFEIAQYFVSDNPPAALVDRMAQTYLQTDGDIRAVLHTMIYSPEFWSRETYRAKIKTPFDLVVSAARAVGADVEIPLQLVQWTGRIGEPLYQCQPPTGYSDKAEAWVNTGALLNRLNYSLALASNRLRGVTVGTAALLGSGGTDTVNISDNPSKVAHDNLDRAIALLLSGEVSPETRKTLENQLSNPQALQASLDDPVTQINDGLIAGLVLGSPEFQRR
jgi:uncharacterized protein (DUF1800 family)